MANKFSWEGTSVEGIRHLLKRDKLHRGDELIGYRINKREEGNVGGSKLLDLYFKRDGAVLLVTLIHQNNQTLSIRKNSEWYAEGFHPDNYLDNGTNEIWLYRKYTATKLISRPVELM